MKIMNKRLILFHNTSIVGGYSSSCRGVGRQVQVQQRRNVLLCLVSSMLVVAATGFVPPTRLSLSSSSSLPLQVAVDVVEMNVDEGTQVSNVIGQPEYSISSIDLSRRWLQLVQDGKVSATVRIPYDDDTVNNDEYDDGSHPPVMASVQYGVRVMTRNAITKCEEFVIQQQDDDNENSNRQHNLVKQINTTLANLQEQSQDEDKQSSSSTVKYHVDDDGFVAQLQLVRTLRPPPSPGFATSTTSQPPNYDETTDSFVTGPLRLQLRPLVGTLSMKDDDTTNKNTINTPWDVYHNVSPADSRGHFLIIPTLSADYKDKNWRGQLFTKEDCHDVVQLTSTIDPIGNIFVGYNSVGAGASQNHIHCHMWPCPPIPLLERVSKVATSSDENGEDDEDYDDGEEEFDHAHDHSHDHDHTHSHEHLLDCDESGEATNIEKMQNDGWDCYPVSKVNEIYDFHDIYDEKAEVDEDGDDEPSAVVEVSYLKYPVFCVQLSARRKHLTRLGQALATTLDSIGSAPYNIGFLNRPVSFDDDDDVAVDVYLFVRSKERSDVLPSLKLGVSEMMGIFHAQSDAELELLVPSQNDNHNGQDAPTMVRALQDISYQDGEELWETIKSNLS